MSRADLLKIAARKVEEYEIAAGYTTADGFDDPGTKVSWTFGRALQGYDIMADTVTAILRPHMRALQALALAKIKADANAALVAAGCARLGEPKSAAALVDNQGNALFTDEVYVMREFVGTGSLIRHGPNGLYCSNGVVSDAAVAVAGEMLPAGSKARFSKDLVRLGTLHVATRA